MYPMYNERIAKLKLSDEPAGCLGTKHATDVRDWLNTNKRRWVNRRKFFLTCKDHTGYEIIYWNRRLHQWEILSHMSIFMHDKVRYLIP